MLERGDAAGSAIPRSKLEPMQVVCWWVHGSFCFTAASTMVREGCGETVDDVVPVTVGSGISSLGEDDGGWSLGDALLSKNVDVHTSLFVDFMAIQSRCRQLNLPVSYKAGNVCLLALRAFDAF